MNILAAQCPLKITDGSEVRAGGSAVGKGGLCSAGLLSPHGVEATSSEQVDKLCGRYVHSSLGGGWGGRLPWEARGLLMWREPAVPARAEAGFCRNS